MNRNFLATPEEIQKRSYFEHAAMWYSDMFLCCYFQKSVLLVILGSMAFLLLVLVHAAHKQFPLQRQVQYVSFVSSGADYSADIITDNSLQDARLVVSKCLIQDYVETRENYNYQVLAKRIKYVAALSTKAELQKYYDQLATSNPQSLVLKYKDNYIREAKVQKVTFLDDNNALVVFDSKVYNKYSQTLLSHDVETVQITFDADPVNEETLKKKDYYFEVTNYQIEAPTNVQ